MPQAAYAGRSSHAICPAETEQCPHSARPDEQETTFRGRKTGLLDKKISDVDSVSYRRVRFLPQNSNLRHFTGLQPGCS